ncbi:SDR family NAD(P)-dependent oxidoreductase [Crocinitomix catalasitica]|nr:SDR family NAD(P)-dependent oxidoreductase [Crocinitomix catalasitica]
MRKILITGGAGNIGSALADNLLADGKSAVTVVDNLTTGELSKVNADHQNMTFIEADVNDYDSVKKIMGGDVNFDYVFHYAAMVGVKRTQADPLSVLRDIDGIRHLLGFSKDTGVKRFFYSSSSEVYGEPVTIPQNEDTTPLNSRVPYAVVKNVGESYCRSFQQEYGLKYTVFRFFNTYGPHQTVDFVVSRFIAAAMKGEEITIYGTGSQSRTFCYVDDNIEATVKALDMQLFVNDVVNIGGARIIPIMDLARIIIKLTKSSSKIVHLPPLPDGDMTRRQPDNTKMRSILNRDLISIEAGINKMIVDPIFLKLMNLN